MTTCNKTRYGQQEAAAAVKRRTGSFSYQCASCDGIHVDNSDKAGKTLLASNDGEKHLIYFNSKIDKVG